MKTHSVPEKLTSSSSFSIAFDGDNQIDATLLGLALSNTSFALQEALSSDPLKPELTLKVSAFQKGSFEVVFQAILVAVNQISTLYSVQDAAAIFDILKGMIDIKKAIKGKKPKAVIPNEETGFVHVECEDGTSVIAPLRSKIVISNPTIDRKMSELGKAVQLHNPNGGFRLTSPAETVHYDQSDVEDISLEVDAAPRIPYEKRYTVQAYLPIRKVDLLGNAAWSFRYGGKTINASIEDNNFLANVHNGTTSYKAGDKLFADMTITENYAWDDSLTSISYTIKSVHSIVSSD